MADVTDLNEYRNKKRKESKTTKEREHQLGRLRQWKSWLLSIGKNYTEGTSKDYEAFKKERPLDPEEDPWRQG